MKKATIWIILGLLGIVAAITVYSFNGKSENRITQQERDSYKILKKWELPNELEEVSGIAWLDSNRLAAVQDEKGIIFIYNLQSSSIEEEIEFNSGGDFEGIAIAGENAYVLRSDGEIFEILNFMRDDPITESFPSALSAMDDIDVEGLTYDKKNNRLLLAVKERKDRKENKAVYSFGLNPKSSAKNALLEIPLDHSIFRNIDGDIKNRFTPSEIAIHPTTGEYYMLDGRNPKVLILEPNGNPSELFILDERTFNKPEGIIFSPGGTLYISNEAGDEAANILEVSLKR